MVFFLRGLFFRVGWRLESDCRRRMSLDAWSRSREILAGDRTGPLPCALGSGVEEEDPCARVSSMSPAGMIGRGGPDSWIGYRPGGVGGVVCTNGVNTSPRDPLGGDCP